MAEDVTKFIHQQNLGHCVLIGHSMYAETIIATDQLGLGPEFTRANQLMCPTGVQKLQ